MDSVQIGDSFGRLTIIAPASRIVGARNTYRAVRCRCECGKEIVARLSSIRDGNTKSCGCLMREMVSKRRFIHGYAKTKIYALWRSMIARCELPTSHAYADYGGRGIKVCERWHSFPNFLEDMGMSPKGTSLDRIDNSGNYCKENCEWRTRKQQARNRRSSRFFEWRGEKRILPEWAEILGIKFMTLRMRLNAGWSVEKMLSTPVNQMRLPRAMRNKLASNT